MSLDEGRLHAVVSPSWRLRDALLEALVAAWSGPVKRQTEPRDLEGIVLGLDTPSLFEPPACWVVGGGERWLARQRDLLLPLVDQPPAAGVLVLVTERLPRNEALGKRLAAAGRLHAAEVPRGRELEGWLIQHLLDQSCEVSQPRAVAEALIAHRGDDIDGLLAAFDQAVDYAGDAAVDAAAIHAVVGGDAEQPIWAFTDAVLAGHAAKAVRTIHAGSGLEPHQALGALVGEIRKCLCCLVSEDDREAGGLAGLRGQPRLYHARRRARELGRRCLERLLTGALQAQRDLRRGGIDPELTLETLVLNVQRVIRLGGGRGNAPARRRSRT